MTLETRQTRTKTEHYPCYTVYVVFSFLDKIQKKYKKGIDYITVI